MRIHPQSAKALVVPVIFRSILKHDNTLKVSQWNGHLHFVKGGPFLSISDSKNTKNDMQTNLNI